MVVAYHLIFGAYGFWLPNDPRGSWSEFVWAWELRRFGEATKVGVRRSVAGRPHDYVLRQEAKGSLAYAPVKFEGEQAVSIGRGFARAAAGERVSCVCVFDFAGACASCRWAASL